jgi:hypothetical protein
MDEKIFEGKAKAGCREGRASATVIRGLLVNPPENI